MPEKRYETQSSAPQSGPVDPSAAPMAPSQAAQEPQEAPVVPAPPVALEPSKPDTRLAQRIAAEQKIQDEAKNKIDAGTAAKEALTKRKPILDGLQGVEKVNKTAAEQSGTRLAKVREAAAKLKSAPEYKGAINGLQAALKAIGLSDEKLRAVKEGPLSIPPDAKRPDKRYPSFVEDKRTADAMAGAAVSAAQQRRAAQDLARKAVDQQAAVIEKYLAEVEQQAKDAQAVLAEANKALGTNGLAKAWQAAQRLDALLVQLAAASLESRLAELAKASGDYADALNATEQAEKDVTLALAARDQATQLLATAETQVAAELDKAVQHAATAPAQKEIGGKGGALSPTQATQPKQQQAEPRR